MEAETVQLLITVLGTVTAGVLGAVVAGILSRNTALQTSAENLRLAAEARAAERSREHARWLRESKKEAYDDFLVAGESLVFNLARRTALPDSEVIRTARGRLKVVGSVPVRKAAAGVIEAATRVWLLGDKDAIGGNDFEVDVRLAGLQEAVDAFVQAAREDLGASTELDHELRIASQPEREKRLGDALGRQIWGAWGGGGEEEEEE